MQTGPRNPFLADSSNPIGHGRSDQQDNVAWRGPEGPSAVLSHTDIQYQWTGAGNFGQLISAPYPDRKRVLWNNGRSRMYKLDYDTLEILSTLQFGEEEDPTVDEMIELTAKLDELNGWDAVEHAIGISLRFFSGLDGVYALLDNTNTVFLGRKDHAVAYVETDPADRASAIVERDRWERPDHIGGFFVGMGMTFDGRLVLTTDHGWIVCLARDFSEYQAVQLPGGAEEAADYCAMRAEERGHTGYGWLRTSMCVGEDNAIYVSSNDHHHKVIWTGQKLSFDEADGAWSIPYRNGGGCGSGTTPCLMGFGPDEDRLVVFGDGDEVVNITVAWRDEIPDDWEQLPNAPHRRIAGIGPANMGNPDLTQIKTEQSITVSGYGAMTVNNEPASVPDGFPDRGARMLAFQLPHKPEYTPHGLHKYEWDPVAREFTEAWVNKDVSSPNAVPFVSQASDIVYTCGVRDQKFTVEGVDWTTGESRFHFVLGGARFNTVGAGMTIDEEGHLLFGNLFGKTRVLRGPGEDTE